MIYEGKEYTDEEILQLITKEDDVSLNILKEDEDSWKIRITEEIYESSNLGLRCRMVYEYFIDDVSEKKLCKCIGQQYYAEVI